MILTVGQGQQFNSPQVAIDYLVNYLGSNKTLTEETTIEIYQGVYGGFVIPDNSIIPTSTARLIITSRQGYKVVISGDQQSTTLGNGSNMVGIGIGTGTQCVTIKDLIIEKFHKGIVLSAGCDRTRIYGCFIKMSANVGIWVYRSNMVQISNCVVLDSGTGIAATEVDDIAIISNDIVTYTDPPTINASIEKFGLHLTSRAPNSLTPNGNFIVYSNNISMVGGALIGYGHWVIQKLRSDKNNLYSINGLYSKSITTPAINPPTHSLAEWQAMSINDPRSISTSPTYYIRRKVGNSVFTSVELQNYITYGGLGQGFVNLCLIPASGSGSSVGLGGLPYYVDTDQLCNTIQSNSTSGTPTGTTSLRRPATTSIGAFDSNLDVYGFFSSSMMPVGSVQEDSCGGSYSFINTIEEKYSNSVDCIHPSVKAGFFYVNDAQYYLYANKEAHYIGDIIHTDIILAATIVDVPSDGCDGIEVYLDNQKLSSDSYNMSGNKLTIKHKGLNISNFNSRVMVLGSVGKWDGSGFIYETFRQETRIRDGVHRYVLPSKPTRGAPIVITDDTIGMTHNPIYCGREFTEEINGNEEVEVRFGGQTNLIENPQFDYKEINPNGYGPDGKVESRPMGWTIEGDASAYVVSKLETTDSVTIPYISYGFATTGETSGGNTGTTVTNTGYVFRDTATGSYDIYPVIGSNILTMYHDMDTGAGVSQRIKINHRAPYWLTFYSCSVREPAQTGQSVFSGNVHVTWKYFDFNGRRLDYPTGDIYSGVAYLPVTSDFSDYDRIWGRYGLAFSSSRDTTMGKVNPSGIVLLNSMINDPIQIPSGAYYMDILIGCTGYSALSAVSFAEGFDPLYYTRQIKGTEATIEYDTGVSDLYRIDDLTITPVRNTNHNGFLYIGAIPARQFDKDAPLNTTTLTDWGWATGRLEYLPWARTSGKNKLSNRGHFNTRLKGSIEDVAITPEVCYPDQIEVIPRIPIALMKDGIGPSEQIPISVGDAGPGVKGTDITIRVIDNYGNPYAFENVTAQVVDQLGQPAGYGYCGLLGKKELGIYSQYSTYVTAKTDSAGCVNLRWIPPASDNAQVEISEPRRQIKVEFIGGATGYYINDLPFRVNPMSMGNPMITTPLKPQGYPTFNEATAIEEFIAPFAVTESENGNRVFAYKLSQVPHRQTVDVWANLTGQTPFNTTGSVSYIRDSYDLSLDRSEVPELSDGEFYVDEIKKTIFVAYNRAINRGTNDPNQTIRTMYSSRNVYLQSDDDGVVDNRKYYISQSLYNQLTGDVSRNNPLSLTYDIVVDLLVTAHSPTGITSEYIDVSSIYGDTTVDIKERNLVTSMIGKSQISRIGI
jgi:Right handed beta helix region